MTVDRDLVLELESLSAIALSEEERAAAQADLQGMIDRFDKLDELDTEGVEPLTYVFPLANVMREDAVAESIGIEALLANAKRVKDGAFAVPRAVE
ncbi:MAG: Asp-tRNA(Asn)/Glu-tRNA(Gln) amidotransferase subunit GatC [Firmicutes bacterium]|nr:Asp-tRNA(Asn)/Glu-tRNA(Gln) amidotransferase subunit GatC [Bacillota bacterium]